VKYRDSSVISLWVPGLEDEVDSFEAEGRVMDSTTRRPPHGGSEPRRPVLVICGSGNAGHALAVATSQNFDGVVDWLVGSEEKAERLRRSVFANGLQSTGVVEARAHKLRTISSDPAQIIPDADLVLIAVPAFAHASVLGRIGPHVSESAAIGCLPTRGGFEFEASQVVSGANVRRRRGRIFGLQTLPWSTRVVSPGEVVHFGAVKAEVVMAALPANEGQELAGQLSKILGTRIVATDAFLNLTLGNPGQFVHPGLMYGHFRSWEGEEYTDDSIPMFYADVTDDMGRLVEQLSYDAIAVARAIKEKSSGALDLSGVVPVHEWLKSSYSDVTADRTSVATCFRTGPIQARQAPMIEVGPGRFVPNFSYRYLSEDVPFGLVITKGIAEIANVPTPAIDEVISWAQSKMEKCYLTNGKLEGPDARDLPIPQNYGISTLPDLIAWYNDDAMMSPRKSDPDYAPAS
jgi:NAD/NADP octopine/nopaline dehydrogenase, alpha-helical domain